MKNRVAAWKILFPLLLGIVVMTVAFIRITYSAFREYEIHDCVSYAKGLTWLIKDEILDPNKVNEYVEKGATCLLSTHVLSEVNKYCKTAAIMREGRLTMLDSPKIDDETFLSFYEDEEDK